MKCYKQTEILSVGPEDHAMQFYHLTTIAVDYVKIIQSEKAQNRGCDKIPKNTTSVKKKIVDIILSQQMLHDNKYALSQGLLVGNLYSLWGSASSSEVMYHNYKLRLFDIFQRLTEGVTSREGLDDPALSPTGIF